MKRFLSTLFCLLLVVAAFAQTSNGHMKYMGIPITGTIAQFQEKLVAKGVKYNQQLSGMLEAGTRSFNGTFAGNKVTIFVYYDIRSTIVYRVKSVIEDLKEDIAEQKYASMRQLFMQKYDEISYGEQNDKEALSVYTDNGRIDMYISKNSLAYPYEYSVHIDYLDASNSNKNDDSRLDDI